MEETEQLTESLLNGNVQNEPPVTLDKVREDSKEVLKEVCHIRSFQDKDSRLNIIIPVIVNISMKAVGNVDTVNMTVDIKFTLAIFCNVEGLDMDQQRYVKKKLSIFLDDVEMDLDKARRKIRKDVISFIYRGEGKNYFHLKRSYLRYLPFDHHWMNIKFTLADIEHTEKRKKKKKNKDHEELEKHEKKHEKHQELEKVKCVYRFDCLVCPKRNEMVQYRPHYDRIPEWNIAISETDVELQMETKKESDGNEINYNPDIIIRIKLYREPGYLIYIVMLPLLILNLCTLAVYGLGADSYADKLSILVTLLLTMFAFIPTIRASIPKVPFITFLDLQVFFSISLIFTGVLETVINGLFTEDGAGLIVKYVFVAISAFVIFISICVNGLFWYPYKMKCLYYREEAKKIMNNFEKKASYDPNDWFKYKQYFKKKEPKQDTEKKDTEKKDTEKKDEKKDFGFFYLWGLGGTPSMKKV